MLFLDYSIQSKYFTVINNLFLYLTTFPCFTETNRINVIVQIQNKIPSVVFTKNQHQYEFLQGA